MTRSKAFYFSLAIVLLGVVVRAAPYLDRIAQLRMRDPAVSQSAHGEPAKKLIPQTARVPSRLSHRPVELLVIGLAVEAFLIGSMLYVALRSPLIAATFGAVAVPYQAGAIGLVTALVVGLLGGTDQTFPFMPWRMYSGMSPGGIQIYQFVGTTQSGRAVRLDMDELLPALGSQRFYNTLLQETTAVQEETKPSQRADLRAGHEATLQALGRLYNRKHADDPIQRITVRAATVPPEELRTQSNIAHHELWSIPVD